MTHVLVADSIGKSYAGRKILNSASLRATPGRITALFGRNGAGKSTLMKIAAGWIAPDFGVVHFDGKVHLRARLHDLANVGLFYLPDRAILTPGLSICTQLQAAAARSQRNTVEEVAETLGIAKRLAQRPGELSGGELRRAEFALAIVRTPKCLLADEPYRGLAPFDAEVLSHALRALAAQGVAIIISGHEVSTLADVADDVTWCIAGTTCQYPSIPAAMDDWRFREQYLGT